MKKTIVKDLGFKTWTILNSEKVKEFVALFPEDMQWMDQALRAFMEYVSINAENPISKLAYKYGCWDEIIIDYVSEITDEIKPVIKSHEITIDLLKKEYSLESVGISKPTLDDALSREFPKYALLKQARKDNPLAIRAMTNNRDKRFYKAKSGLPEIYIQNPDNERVLEKICFDELPLNDLEEKMFTHIKVLLKVAQETLGILLNAGAIYKGYHKFDYSTISRWLNWKEYSTFEYLYRGGERLQDELIDSAETLKDLLLNKKKRAESLEEKDITKEILESIPETQEKINKYLDKVKEAKKEYQLELELDE